MGCINFICSNTLYKVSHIIQYQRSSPLAKVPTGLASG